MAEVTGLRNNALPYPIYGAPWGVIFPMLDADGDLVTGASTPDAERSLNGDTFADCTNESTEIATNSGMYYLLLTAAEMTADVVSVIAKSATAGMKTTAMAFYPRKLVTIRSGTSASGGVSTSTIVLDASASAVDDFYNGMVCIATIDSNVEVRVISDYTGSTQTATVVPDWNVAPDNNDTFVIKLPEGVQLNQANVSHAASIAWGSGAITAGSIATDAIGAAEIADGAITAATFAAGAIDAAAIATGAIDADALAADAGTEIGTAVWATTTRALTILDEDSTTLDLDATIRAAVGLASANLDTQLDALPTAAENADAVWDEDATGHQTGGTFGQAIGDPVADTNTIYGAVVTGAAGATVAADIIAVKAETATILADTNELQTDWVDGGRLDLILDARASQTSVDDLPTNAELTTALGTADDAVLAQVALVKAKTDLIPGTIDGYTFAQGWTLTMSALFGKASGLATTTAVYRAVDDTKDRITATVDADGNRTALTLDAA